MKILDIFKRKDSMSDIELTEKVRRNGKITITKEEFRQRKKTIDEITRQYIDDHKNDIIDRRIEENKRIEAENRACPMCKSNDSVVHKFVKKGTNVFKYNHCNACGHEWEHNEPADLDINVDNIKYVIGRFLDSVALNLLIDSYNPIDISCEYDSAEEMEAAKIKMLKEQYPRIINLPLEVIYHIGYDIALESVFEEELIFGCNWTERYKFFDNENGKSYTGRFTTDMENALVNKLGVKKIFKYE